MFGTHYKCPYVLSSKLLTLRAYRKDLGKIGGFPIVLRDAYSPVTVPVELVAFMVLGQVGIAFTDKDTVTVGG